MSATATATRTLPGFDVEKLESFNAYAAQNPNDVVLGLQARTTWEGKGGESLAKIGPWSLAGNRIEKPTRDFSIQFGAWKEVEEAIGVDGAHDRIEPVEAALAALAACVNWAICINAAREGLTFEGLQVTAKAQVDPRNLLGIVDESTSCMQKVEMDIEVKGDLSPADLARIKAMADRSPVHALVTHANSIVKNVTRA